MDRQDVLKRLLYPKCKTAIEFKFDSLRVDPLLSYITFNDIMQLHKIATSIKYSSKIKEKYAMIDNIMTARGFRKMASGTNRVTYRCLNDYRVVIKIAIDKVGLSDNGNEFHNQHLLKPFVTKCFEVSPCGTVGLFERVVPITSREEFINISDDIFDLINNLIGKYVLEDIGEKYYMNYGLREGFGPVLLDYPYVFELDGKKLICNVPDPMELKGYCGGEIDYDLGYNDLKCKKCGKRYLATDLKSDVKSDKPKIIIEGEDTMVRCVLKRGDEIVSTLNSEAPASTNTIKSKKDFTKLKSRVREVSTDKSQDNRNKPSIKTCDDVHVRVRIRGLHKRNVVDLDAKARKEEEESTIKIPISFAEKPVEKVVGEVVDSPSVATLTVEELTTPEDVDRVLKHMLEGHPDEETQDVQLQDEPDPSSTETTTVIIRYGMIYDLNDNLIGYLLPSETPVEYLDDPSEVYHQNEESVEEETETEVDEPSYDEEEAEPNEAYDETSEEESYEKEVNVVNEDNKSDEDAEVVYTDSDSYGGNTLGNLCKKQLENYNNTNRGGGYKTSDVTTKMDGHFASKKKIAISEETKRKINSLY